MKAQIKLILTLAAGMVAFTSPLFAQLAIPSDGSDGALVISSNTVIDLSLAVTGNWTNNNSANAGKGIYDPSKWAVVFKYSSVVISNGATLTFINHPTHAPVIWLVGGDVTIQTNGTLSLDGQSATGDPVNLPEPGPGGFRGGAESQSGLGDGGGFGPGGYYRDYGSYSTYRAYGNPQIVPLIGGSGGSGNGSSGNGGGGGGAILIAASGNITVNGSCHANAYNFSGTYSGSGGGLRLVANQILGNGMISASGIYLGRVRLEANTASTAISVNPPTIAVSPSPLIIWPATNAPTVQIVSVASLSTPADPLARMSVAGDDLTLATTNTVAIVLQTLNFPTNGTVNVYIKPRNFGGPQLSLQASYVSGNTNSAIWQLNTILPTSHGVIQARAVY